MKNVINTINSKNNQEAFILDHGKLVDGILKYRDDLESYSWNKKQNNKLKVGALVLNRRPGKLNKDRKFTIYGGGIISDISEPDNEGNVVAKISDPFKIIPEIRQGDPFIEEFQWTHKNKKPGTWEHFWNQYGINRIHINDFKKIIDYANCIPYNEEYTKDITDDQIDALQIDSKVNFKVIISEVEDKKSSKLKNSSIPSKKIDFDKIQKAKNRIGALGEQIVFNLLTEQANQEKLKHPIHVSKEKGDGLGYDILFFDKNEEEVYIEVKTTSSKYSDGFEMSINEIRTSQDKNHQYKIYRISELNLINKECKLKMYVGPIDTNNFVLETISVKVYKK